MEELNARSAVTIVQTNMLQLRIPPPCSLSTGKRAKDACVPIETSQLDSRPCFTHTNFWRCRWADVVSLEQRRFWKRATRQQCDRADCGHQYRYGKPHHMAGCSFRNRLCFCRTATAHGSRPAAEGKSIGNICSTLCR